MKLIKVGILLGIASLIIHAILQFILTKYIEWPAIEEYAPITIIIAMILLVVIGCVVLKTGSGNSKQKFLEIFIPIVIMQFLTIVSLTTNYKPTAIFDLDLIDLLIRFLIFAIGLPLIICSFMMRVNRRNIR